MSSGLTDQGLTPLAALVDALETSLAETTEAPAWALTPAELTDLLPRLARAKRQLDAVELRMLREADRLQVGDPLGYGNTTGWWATTTRMIKPTAHRQVALAERLDQDEHTTAASATNAGAVSLDQAAVIVNAIDALPADLVGP